MANPQTRVRGTPVPETPVPETRRPETRRPESHRPESHRPETRRAGVRVVVRAAAVRAPGLADWEQALPALRGDAPFRAAPLELPPPPGLPPNERRRVPASVRLALHVAADAIARAGVGESTPVRAVFACSGGNAEALDAMLDAIVAPGAPVSPRQFAQMDHDAAAGYWSIARGPAGAGAGTSVGAYDGSFAAGLLEAAVTTSEASPVLLVACDVPPPAALRPSRPVEGAFAAALVLAAGGARGAEGARARWRCRPLPDGAGCSEGPAEDRCADPGLERLRRGNPGARCLPLLALLATGGAGAVVLPWLPGLSLMVEQEPC